LRRLEVQRRPGERVVLESGSEGAFASWVEREPSEKRLRKLAGRVDDNLYLAMSRAGGGAGLVVEFADLFAWDFDFFTDTRSGDTFDLLVEEEWVGGERVGTGRILAGRYHPVGEPEPLVAYFYTWEDGELSGYYDGGGRSLRKFFLKSPLQFRRISSHFTHKRLHPIHKTYRPHLGVDYAAPTGTPVVALGNGKIVYVGWKGGYGRTVQIKHNATYLTQYAHLSRYGKGMKSGARVKQGQTIGFVGSSGVATGPHLDFRVRENGKWINPLHLKGGQSKPLPEGQRAAFAEIRGHLQDLLETMTPGRARPLPSGELLPALALARLDTLSAS
jgi:murein DD-endopeptidase MepM/ murein hydrolase activator NlpD